jgi:hypothetical protein
MSNGTVFVVQATRFQADVSPAAVYGDIRFVLTPGDRSSSTPDLSFNKLMDALGGFDPATDYVLWSGGDPLSCMLAGIVLAELGITRFRFLRYEKDRSTPEGQRPNNYYVPVEVDFTPQEEEIPA